MTENTKNTQTIIEILLKIKSILTDKNIASDLDFYIKKCDIDLKNIKNDEVTKLKSLNLYDLGTIYFSNRSGDWQKDKLLKLMFDAHDLIDEIEK